MAGEIKVLSAQGLLDNDPAFLTTLRDALTSQGVFHLSDCQLLFGDDAHCLDAAIAATKAFFALPTSEKQRFNRSKDRAAGFSDKELTYVCVKIFAASPTRQSNRSTSLTTAHRHPENEYETRKRSWTLPGRRTATCPSTMFLTVA